MTSARANTNPNRSAMQAKGNRRGSVEIQQLTTWKHQQNLEEIKMLKASTTGAVSSPASAPPSLNTPSKLSKLVARIQRTSNEVASPVPEKAHTDQGAEIRPVGGKPALFQPPAPIIAHHENFGKLTSAATAVTDAANRNDFELLLKEKQHWLRTIHEDNTKMAAMLKDLKEAKVQLDRKLSELDNERHRLAQASSAADEIEDYLEEESDLCSARREAVVPARRLPDATELLRDLLIVTGQFRSNQGETREFFYKTVRQTVGSFVAMVAAEEDRRERLGSLGAEDETTESDAADEAWQQHLSVLRTLAAAGPGNVRAAETIAASAASAVIRAAGERTGDLLQLHQTAVEKRQQLVLKDEIRALRKENDELKGSVAKLRKSNVQLRVRAAATAMMAPGMPGDVLSDTEGGAEGSIAGKAWGASSEAKSAYDDPLGRSGVLSEDGTAEAGPVSSAEELRNAGDALISAGEGTAGMLQQSAERLPKAVEKYLLRELAAQAQLVIEGHPLGANLSDSMVSQLTGDLSREVQGIAAAAFFAYMHHRQGLSELPDCLLDGTISSIDSDAAEAPRLSAVEKHVVEQVKEAVEHVLQVSSVHTELSALATLYLTYLHCRPKAEAEMGTAAAAGDADSLNGTGPTAGSASVHSLHSRVSRTDTSVDTSKGGGTQRRVPAIGVGAQLQRSKSGRPRSAEEVGGANAAQSPDTLKPDRLAQSASGSPLPRYMQANGKR